MVTPEFWTRDSVRLDDEVHRAELQLMDGCLVAAAPQQDNDRKCVQGWIAAQNRQGIQAGISIQTDVEEGQVGGALMELLQAPREGRCMCHPVAVKLELDPIKLGQRQVLTDEGDFQRLIERVIR